MKSKIIYGVFIAMFLSVLSAEAQRPQGPRFDREEAKTLKVGVYTRVLDLTQAEAEKFWPVFNEFESEMEAIRKEKMEIRQSVERDFSGSSDKEIEEQVDRMMELELEEAQLKQVYYEKYKKILPIKKVALIHRAETMFKRSLLEKMREKDISSPKR